ncbi:MAG TPA: hypothetical protein VMV18_06210 [bacterium]|nr:hypothetical protein [bacterium]
MAGRTLGRFDWTALRRKAAPERSWAIDEGKFWGLSFSRDGKSLVYVAHVDGTCEIRVVGADGRGLKVITATRADELVSEMHGFTSDDRGLVYGVARSGADHELWTADLGATDGFEVTRRMAQGYFFAGWADDYDAVYVFDRSTGERKTFRINFRGDVVQVNSRRLDRTVAITADGNHLFYSEKEAERRFSIWRAGIDGTNPERIAEVATGCFARRLQLELSPDGEFLHASALGPADGALDQLLSFNLLLSTDGKLRRTIPVKGWASGHRAIVGGEGRSLMLADLRKGTIAPFIDQAVDHFTVSRDGRRCAYVSGRHLRVSPVPA